VTGRAVIVEELPPDVYRLRAGDQRSFQLLRASGSVAVLVAFYPSLAFAANSPACD
jgi:hypothetical protein